MIIYKTCQSYNEIGKPKLILFLYSILKYDSSKKTIQMFIFETFIIKYMPNNI